MKILVTGHQGYIGTVLVPLLRRHGHDVHGFDYDLFTEQMRGSHTEPVPARIADIRDATADDLAGFDNVVHLAAISNDPLGDLNPECTYAINHEAAVHVAEVAKAAGVPRFVFSSSCSVYGAGGDDVLDERSPFNPVTPYGHAKALAEVAILQLADDDFSPTALRSATAYGASPRLRGDLVVNNLTGWAVTTGEIRLKSDGSPVRPLVHVEDIARAMVAVAEAPREAVHGEAFNVGVTTENYRIREVAELIGEVLPSCTITFADGAGPDTRNYRVDCEKLRTRLSDFRPQWDVRRGIEELVEAFSRDGTTIEELGGPRFQRLAHVRALQDAGLLDDALRWQPASSRVT